jgi:UDP-N-acetylglucosamine--N-acetylmuramyl-(pentapeptide) pyrophosphoryl-undecaprenol N-acetylglucosamine transferase
VLNSKVVFTGNPVRSEILKGRAEEGYRLTGFHPGKPIVLVMGGSQGAQQINELLIHDFYSLVPHFQIIHITGKGKQTGLQHPSYIQFEYVGEELKHLYAITDLVVSRAGANSLYELALMKKPNILIPLSNADQLGNAAYFQQQGGSVILDTPSLNDILLALWKNSDQTASMKEALGRLARPEAAQRIAGILLGH